MHVDDFMRMELGETDDKPEKKAAPPARQQYRPRVAQRGRSDRMIRRPQQQHPGAMHAQR